MEVKYQKTIGLTKADQKHVAPNILQAAFLPIFFCQKITKINCKKKKAVKNTFIQKAACKMLMKLTPGIVCFLFG